MVKCSAVAAALDLVAMRLSQAVWQSQTETAFPAFRLCHQYSRSTRSKSRCRTQPTALAAIVAVPRPLPSRLESDDVLINAVCTEWGREINLDLDCSCYRPRRALLAANSVSSK